VRARTLMPAFLSSRARRVDRRHEASALPASGTPSGAGPDSRSSVVRTSTAIEIRADFRFLGSHVVSLCEAHGAGGVVPVPAFQPVVCSGLPR
jgi:hypothetical protein